MNVRQTAVVKQDLPTEGTDVCVLQDLQENIAKKVRKNLCLITLNLFTFTI